MGDTRLAYFRAVLALLLLFAPAPYRASTDNGGVVGVPTNFMWAKAGKELQQQVQADLFRNSVTRHQHRRAVTTATTGELTTSMTMPTSAVTSAEAASSTTRAATTAETTGVDLSSAATTSATPQTTNFASSAATSAPANTAITAATTAATNAATSTESSSASSTATSAATSSLAISAASSSATSAAGNTLTSAPSITNAASSTATSAASSAASSSSTSAQTAAGTTVLTTAPGADLTTAPVTTATTGFEQFVDTTAGSDVVAIWTVYDSVCDMNSQLFWSVVEDGRSLSIDQAIILRRDCQFQDRFDGQLWQGTITRAYLYGVPSQANISVTVVAHNSSSNHSFVSLPAEDMLASTVRDPVLFWSAAGFSTGDVSKFIFEKTGELGPWSFGICPGDLFDAGKEVEFDITARRLHQAQLNSVYLATGPDDVAFGGEESYRRRIASPVEQLSSSFFSVNLSIFHLVAVSTREDYNPGSIQYDWLAQDLARANASREYQPWIVVTGFDAMYGSCTSDTNGDQNVRAIFEPLFERYGVDIALWGSLGHYERTHPVFNFTRSPYLNGTGNAVYPYILSTLGGDRVRGTIHFVLPVGGQTDGKGLCTNSPPDWRASVRDVEFAYGNLRVFATTDGVLRASFANQLGLADDLYYYKEIMQYSTTGFVPTTGSVSATAFVPPHLPLSLAGHSSSATGLGIGVVIALVIVCLVCLLMVGGALVWRFRKSTRDLNHRQHSNGDISLVSQDDVDMVATCRSPKIILEETGVVQLTGIKLEKKIGSGAFGDVFKGKWRGSPCALKCLNVDGVNAEEGFADFLKELSVLKEVNHPGIVRFLGIASAEDVDDSLVSKEGTQKPDVFLVTEFCGKGSLKACLDERTIDVSQVALTRYVYEMVCGMAYLNSNKISHNDLACRNLLVNVDATVKIADFGLSAVATSSDKLAASHLPVRWSAPEALMTGKHDARKSDVFSFACTSWEIYELGRAPFHWIKTNQEVMEAVLTGALLPQPDLCPNTMYLVLLKCWEHDPDLRIGFEIVREQIEDAWRTVAADGGAEDSFLQATPSSHLRQASRSHVASGPIFSSEHPYTTSDPSESEYSTLVYGTPSKIVSSMTVLNSVYLESEFTPAYPNSVAESEYTTATVKRSGESEFIAATQQQQPAQSEYTTVIQQQRQQPVESEHTTPAVQQQQQPAESEYTTAIQQQQSAESEYTTPIDRNAATVESSFSEVTEGQAIKTGSASRWRFSKKTSLRQAKHGTSDGDGAETLPVVPTHEGAPVSSGSESEDHYVAPPFV